MSSPSTVSAIACVTLFLASAAPARTLNVCAEPDNLPFSRNDGTGFEVEIARLLGRDLNAEVQFVWLSSRNMHGFIHKTLGAGLCDAIMGLPAGVEGAAVTRPYYRTGWMFATRGGDTIPVHSFDDAVLRETVGVPVAGDGYDTVPAAALVRRGALGQLRTFPINGPASDQPAGMLDAVESGAIDVAVAWGPQAGWYAATHPGVRLTPTPVSDNALPLTQAVAVAVAPADSALRDQLDVALERNAIAITAILRKWQVPLLPLEDRQ